MSGFGGFWWIDAEGVISKEAGLELELEYLLLKVRLNMSVSTSKRCSRRDGG